MLQALGPDLVAQPFNLSTQEAKQVDLWECEAIQEFQVIQDDTVSETLSYPHSQKPQALKQYLSNLTLASLITTQLSPSGLGMEPTSNEQ